MKELACDIFVTPGVATNVDDIANETAVCENASNTNSPTADPQPHMHSGRYWFEMGVNLNFEENKSELSITELPEAELEGKNADNCNNIQSDVQRNVPSNEEVLSKSADNQVNFVEADKFTKTITEKQVSICTVIEKSPLSKKKSTVEVESSDEDVIEVAMPPVPLICIDSSDDEPSSELSVKIATKVPSCKSNLLRKPSSVMKKSGQAKGKQSPVPSVVSSASDDFLQNDCTELNQVPQTDSNMYHFNFNLHGSDLASSNLNNTLVSKKTNTAKKRKCKRKQSKTYEEYSSTTPQSSGHLQTVEKDKCFATPNDKKKPHPTKTSFTIKSSLPVPCMDVYESESSDVPENTSQLTTTSAQLNEDDCITLDESGDESYSDLVIANVSGVRLEENNSKTFEENVNYDNENVSDVAEDPVVHQQQKPDGDQSEMVVVSEKSPVDNQLEQIRKYYDDSWGGENFDHRRLINSMPSNKNLWPILQIDLSTHPKKSQTKCSVCNRTGHRGDACFRKQKLCFMCGKYGHTDWNCPQKICLQCGAKSHLFIRSCKQCYFWESAFCNLCERVGHPTNRCPDNWRRYHLTTTSEIPLIELRGTKPKSQQYCSGCANRGHIVNECQNNLKLIFDFVPASIYIKSYEPLYTPDIVRQLIVHDINKLGSVKSNVSNIHKRKSESEFALNRPKSSKHQRSLIRAEDFRSVVPSNSKMVATEDYISLGLSDTKIDMTNKRKLYEKRASNYDSGLEQVIQDNSVSNTINEVFKSSISLTSEDKRMISEHDGKTFLVKLSTENTIQIELGHTDLGDVMYIKGTSTNQHNFKIKLKDWLLESRLNAESVRYACNLPKTVLKVQEKINADLNELNKKHGDPWTIFKQLMLIERNGKNKGSTRIMKKINSYAKTLNMILIGQAGLCGGKEHLNALVKMTKDLKDTGRSTLNQEERLALGRLYAQVFSNSPRNDYDELLKEYAKNRQVTPLSDALGESSQGRGTQIKSSQIKRLQKKSSRLPVLRTTSNRVNNNVSHLHYHHMQQLRIQITCLRESLLQLQCYNNKQSLDRTMLIEQLEYFIQRLSNAPPLSPEEEICLYRMIHLSTQMMSSLQPQIFY